MTFHLLISSLTVILLCGHHVQTQRKARTKPIQTPSIERYNFFDVDLFELLNRGNKNNILVSPISIKVILGMLMEAAGNGSGDEIRTALRLPNDAELARKEFNKWLRTLQNTKSTTILKIASRVFLSDEYSVKERYKNLLERNYKASVVNVRFDNPTETVEIINRWVNNRTSGLIPTLVDESQINGDAKMLLTNAVYFKGKWRNPFSEEMTTPKCFYQGNHECKYTNMMLDTGSFEYGYISTLDAQALELPYEDGRYSMLVLLPKKRNGVTQLSRDLVHVNMDHILSQMKQQEVFVQLPRFKIDFNGDLVGPLQNLQITKVFGPEANFTEILTKSNAPLRVSNIFHSAKITVNEEGSEAAAATGALFVPLMGGPTTSFLAEHPFLFFIRDIATGSVLFTGRVSEPEAAEDPGIVKPDFQPSDKVGNGISESGDKILGGDKNSGSDKASSGDIENQQVIFQGVHTPAPPIKNSGEKDNTYVNRKPGQLPPPPPPPSSSLSSSSSSSSSPPPPPPSTPSSKVSGPHTEPENVGVSTRKPEAAIEETLEPVKPIFTAPPPFFRPTEPATTNRILSTSGRSQVPNFVFYSPVRRMLLPDNAAFQDETFRSLAKRISVFDQYSSFPEIESRKRTRLVQNNFDPSTDKISFFT